MSILVTACQSETPPPPVVDVARVAEAWRSSEEQLSRACSSGFPDFARVANEVLNEVSGAERFQAALAPLAENDPRGVLPEAVAEPVLLRLLLHRYTEVCVLPESENLHRRFEDLEAGPAAERAAGLEAIVESSLGDGLRAEEHGDPEPRLISLEIDGQEEESVVLLACLACDPETPNDGPRQLVAAFAALKAIADSGLRLRRSLQLLICLDAEQDVSDCRRGLEQGETETHAAFALDGMDPLVVAWSGEGSWQLALPHQPAPLRRRPPPPVRRGLRRPIRPYVTDVGVTVVPAQLPSSAMMKLFSATRSTDEVARALEVTAATLSETREGARYEIETVGEEVIVRAFAPALSAWEIDQRRSALWDLAALARQQRVIDPQGGSLAAMLRVVSRFDEDPYGARLGLHYEDPVGGPLLIAPCTLETRGDRVELGFRFYRPPGLSSRDFAARLDDARDRLRAAAGRPLIETGREIGEPGLVSPNSEIVQLVQRAFEDVTGEARLEPGGAPLPGLASLLPQAVAIGLPLATDDPRGDRAAPLLLELVWSLAAVTDPEVLDRSQWR